MTARVDHLVVAAASLEEGVAWCEATLGVVPGPGGEHPLMGTHNRLLRIATVDYPRAYFEIIAIQPGRAPQRARRWFHEEMMKLFADADLIVAPATPCPAPLIGETRLEIRGETLPLRPSLGLFTQPISCVGLPVVLAPVTGGALPIGVQLIAPPWREDLCLRAAHALEAAGVSVVTEPKGPASIA